MSRRQHPCPQRCPLPWPEDHCLGCWCLLPLLQRCLQGCLWCQCRPTCCSRTAGTATELNSYPGMLKTYRVHAYSAKWLMPAFMLAALVLNTAVHPLHTHQFCAPKPPRARTHPQKPRPRIMKEPLLSLAEYAMMPAREAAASCSMWADAASGSDQQQLSGRSMHGSAKAASTQVICPGALVVTNVQHKLAGVCCAWVKPIRTC